MKKILFCGGGTAGHVMPNIAIMQALGGGYEFAYAGGDGLEKSICSERGIKFYHIDTVKLRRDAFFANLAIPFKLDRCVKSARGVLGTFGPDLIFSKGGYAALPIILAAKDIPVIAHESDLSPGIVTKLCRRRAKYILTAFEDTAKLFKNGVYTGTPLRRELYGGVPLLQSARKKPRLLIMGGSSGAATVNQCAAQAMPDLLRLFDVIHITGNNKTGGDDAAGYTKIQFCSDMPAIYASTDIAVSRGGANSLAELVALGIPSVIIPLEKASRGDQKENAKYYADRGAVKVLYERDLTPNTFIAAVIDTFNRRAAYVAAMKKLEPDGTKRICEIIRQTLSDQMPTSTNPHSVNLSQ